MIYEHFCMRLHEDLSNKVIPVGSDVQKPWTLRIGDGALKSFIVGSVSNPIPAIKENKIDVPGTSGELDVYGTDDHVDFQNKPVTIVLSGEASFAGMEEIEDLFSQYQGRVIDFTFDYFLQVEKYQVGRMTAAFDRKRNRVTLNIDTEPYRYSTSIFHKQITHRTNYEARNNSTAWMLDISANPQYANDNVGNFAYSFNTPQAYPIIRYKPVGAQPNSKMLFGIISVVGGKVWFTDDNGNESQTFATVCTTHQFADAEGELRMKFTVDGSYYEWVTTTDGRRYLPTIRCQYILSNYVNIDSDGEIIDDLNANTATTITLPSNIAIYPQFYSNIECWLIADGVAFKYDSVNDAGFLKPPRIVLPRTTAPRDGTMSKSVFCTVELGSTDYGAAAHLRFVPAEVF